MAVRHLNPEGLYALPEMFTHVVSVTDAELVYVSGQVAWDAEGGLVGEGDHAAQAAQVARNIETALAAAGDRVYVFDEASGTLSLIGGR